MPDDGVCRCLGATAHHFAAIFDLSGHSPMKRLRTVANSPNVRSQNFSSFPSAKPAPALKTLDAIHLATASLWRENEDASIFLATHDKQFALAARMMGFPVLGV
jgi:hypothetical protein